VLAIEKVKALTGGDSRKARRMREDYWSFRPTHTMFLASNHRPTVPAGDYGTWRRMRLVKFPYRFVSNPVHANDRVGDPHMRRRLLEQKVNHDAIVTWLVEGAVEYARRGITDTPESVEKATEAWRLDEDPMSVFVTQKVVFSRGARIDSAELVATFNEFIRTAHQRENGWHGKTVVSQFESTASQRGETLTRASSHGRRYLVGVRWRTDADPGIPEASYGEEPETNGQPATGESTLSKILRIGHKPLTRGNDETGDSGD
jgi:putative DNA primase/helicase